LHKCSSWIQPIVEVVSKVKVPSSACGAFQTVDQTCAKADSMHIAAKRPTCDQGAEATFDVTRLDLEGHERVNSNAQTSMIGYEIFCPRIMVSCLSRMAGGS
jgi:hypothetical protein